jgi:hypothetical protein
MKELPPEFAYTQKLAVAQSQAVCGAAGAAEAGAASPNASVAAAMGAESNVRTVLIVSLHA